MNMTKPTYTITDWAIIEMGGTRLFGYSNRYEGKTEKNFIRTSPIIGRRGDAVETVNSIYVLGEAAEGYSEIEMLKEIVEL
jgi:hypothetical protein